MDRKDYLYTVVNIPMLAKEDRSENHFSTRHDLNGTIQLNSDFVYCLDKLELVSQNSFVCIALQFLTTLL